MHKIKLLRIKKYGMDKMEEMIIKKSRKIFLLFFYATILYGCNNKPVEYKISDKYTGPCIVFIYSSNEYINPNSSVIITNGFSKVNNNKMKEKFMFKSIENDIELEIIPIGKITSASNNRRYVFGLTQENQTVLKCQGNIHSLTFFVGHKDDYIKWVKNYDNEFKYFDSLGVDWCKYYNTPTSVQDWECKSFAFVGVLRVSARRRRWFFR